MTAPADRLAAALADRYRIERELGQGGMAVVYLAEDLKHRRQVAVKVLRPELAGALGPDRFLREIETAARLHHPHILPLYDSGDAGGFLYYVMPLAEGESLRDRLRRERQLPLDEALRIAREVADALSYAHAHGVVHRDIKPENILLESGHAVVADFGIARAVSAAGGDRLTQTGLALGTPSYMSPEQAAGDHEIDGRSDLYSLGCVVYEMLAGQPPFTGPTPASVVQQHVTAQAPPIAQLRPAVPLAVAEAIARALAKTPADRFNPVGQFAEAISPAAPGATPPSIAATTLPAVRARRPWRPIALAAVAGALVVAGYLLAPRDRRAAAGAAAPHRIVVLPFENLGTPDQEYFAEGVTEEITSRLGQVPGLGVIARTSAIQYKNTGKSVREVGRELDVGYLLEGTVRWQRDSAGPGRVRVTPQLIRVFDQTHIWAERYDAVLTDIFSVQSRIAEGVADALGLTLSLGDSAAPPPTRNSEAYDDYLRGLVYLNRGWEEADLRVAETRFTEAVRRDSTFALAYAKLAQTHASLYWWRYDHSAARLAQAQSAADRAARLDPDLPEAHHALGLLHYWGRFDYDRALAEFAIARRGRPNDATIALVTGAAERRRGNFQQALPEVDRARTLDPRFSVPAVEYAYTLAMMGRYAEADQAWDRAIAMGPDQKVPYELRSLMHLQWTGDLAKARASLAEGLQRVVLGRSDLTLRLGWLDELEGDHAAALNRLASAEADAINTHEEFIPRADLQGRVHAALGHAAIARAYYDSAEAVVRKQLEESPDAANLRSALGIVLAGQGRRDEALREARRAVELLPITKDAVDGPMRVRDLARTLVMVGDLDGALDQLEVLFRLPAANPLSASLLRLDPVWAPLQGRPRFERLLAAK